MSYFQYPYLNQYSGVPSGPYAPYDWRYPWVYGGTHAHYPAWNSGYGSMDAGLVSGYRNPVPIRDYGSEPFVADIHELTEHNRTFRTALWTGKHLQLTLMSINVGEDIGLEVHPDTDQFLRIEDGHGMVQMGRHKDRLDFQRYVEDDDVILVPAGYWHNVINTGNKPLKLYSIYAPVQHPKGTVHVTKADAMAAER